MDAAVAIFIPFVMSFFTHKTFPCLSTQCHKQLFYRPDATLSSEPALFSCAGPSTVPLAEAFPFYGELQTSAQRGVFTNKIKIFFQEKPTPNTWSKTYFRLNDTSSLLEPTQNPSEATVFTIITSATAPGGRFHFEYHPHDNVPSNTQASSTTPLQLCAKFPAPDSHARNLPCSYTLAAVEDCDDLGSRLITGLLTSFYLLDHNMNQCSRFDSTDF